MRAFLALILIAVTASGCSSDGPPETKRVPVVDVYHGVEVGDDYRWLEAWDDPQVREWSAAQNVYARTYLDALPRRDEIRKRVAEILGAESPSFFEMTWRGEKLFAIQRQPPLDQPFLVTLPGPDGPADARTIVDPNQLDPAGTTSIDWYRPAPDGEIVAVSLSRGGSESGDLHLIEVASGRRIDEVIPRVNGGTAGGDATWTLDGRGIFYTRYPREGERPAQDLDFHQQVWYHALGTASGDDRYELGEDFPKVAEIRLQTDPSSGRVLATMQDGDSGRFEHFLRTTDGTWLQLTRFEDRIVQAAFAPNGSIIMISRLDAPRGKVLRMSPGRLSLQAARTVVEQGKDTIISEFYGPPPMAVTPTRIYLTYQLGGPSTIRSFDHDGRAQSGPDVPPVSSVLEMAPVAGDAILFRNASYVEPAAWYRFEPETGATRKTALVQESPVDFSDVEVLRETVVSKDGTAVPLTVLKPAKVALDGSAAAVLYGYGGFGISLTPQFSPVTKVWLERGGIWAVVNLRGGGEFGEAWHRAGKLTNKQNVFDDFAAAMQHMIDRGYSSPERLAIMGGSNGGLLMGAMITQVPERCRAVVSEVGIYDMLRVELSPNGAFNIPEYGSVGDPEQFRALYAYSPYHNVKDGTDYPAVLLTTGANDPRVDPMQSRKMTARLQAASGSGLPILLRTSTETGHGGGTPLSQRIEELADSFAFLSHETAGPD